MRELPGRVLPVDAAGRADPAAAAGAAPGVRSTQPRGRRFPHHWRLGRRVAVRRVPLDGGRAARRERQTQRAAPQPVPVRRRPHPPPGRHDRRPLRRWVSTNNYNYIFIHKKNQIFHNFLQRTKNQYFDYYFFNFVKLFHFSMFFVARIVFYFEIQLYLRGNIALVAELCFKNLVPFQFYSFSIPRRLLQEAAKNIQE